MNFGQLRVMSEVQKYILGLLPKVEAESVEERLVCDEEFAAEFFMVYDDLVDQFVTGKLPQEDRARFSARMQQLPGLQRKVMLASPFLQWVSKQRIKPINSWWKGWRWAALVPAVALLLLFLWSGWWRSRQSPIVQLSPPVVNAPSPTPSLAEKEIAQSSPPASVPRASQRRPLAPVVLFLSAGVLRGKGDVPVAVVSMRGPFAIQVEILSDSVKTVEVDLTSGQYEKHWPRVAVKKVGGGAFIELVLPSTMPVGTYDLTLDSTTTYQFEIKKKF